MGTFHQGGLVFPDPPSPFLTLEPHREPHPEPPLEPAGDAAARAARDRLADIFAFADEPVSRTEILIALTYAQDLKARGTAGQTLRSCVLGMRIGQQLRLSQQEMDDLYYALLLKDVGCSSNASDLCEWMGMDEAECKHTVRRFDWSRFEWRQLRFAVEHAFANRNLLQRTQGLVNVLRTYKERSRKLVELRCFAAERIARELRFSEETATALRCLEEHWDGKGQPAGLSRQTIPLISQICNLAQTLELVEQTHSRREAIRVIEERCGTWFDPGLAVTVVLMHEAGRLWQNIPPEILTDAVIAMAPLGPELLQSGDLEQICLAFAAVVDAKSHYTFLHSRRVADLCRHIGIEMNLSEKEREVLFCAALLHDIGKLALPNTILDKKGELSREEREAVHLHPVHSYEVLRRIRTFDCIARIARAHHERLDGTGYPDGLSGHAIPLLARILAVADRYDALSSERPYRKNLSRDEVMRILEADVPSALDPNVYAALRRVLARTNKARNVSPDKPHSGASS